MGGSQNFSVIILLRNMILTFARSGWGRYKNAKPALTQIWFLAPSAARFQGHSNGVSEISIQKFPACSENCKWYSSLPVGEVVSLFCVSQSSEFCRHNPLCCFSRSVYFCKRIFRYESVRKLLDTPSYINDVDFSFCRFSRRCYILVFFKQTQSLFFSFYFVQSIKICFCLVFKLRHRMVTFCIKKPPLEVRTGDNRVM
jgi:uncharacterized membrane protein YjjB (DUF3815 family)